MPGLRREEVALLAGVSVDYYARLERGELAGVSDEVLDAIVGVLRLDEAESTHLFNLAREARSSPSRRRRAAVRPEPQIRPSLQRFLDAITGAPTWVRNERMDFIAANPLGRALYAPLLEEPVRPANNARYFFLNPAAMTFYPDWDRNADDIVATLRSYAGRNPHDKGLTDLIGELATRSEDFRTRWAAQNVRFHRTGLKRIHHPVVGELELSYEAMELPANPGLTLLVYTAAKDSPTADSLKLLASWAATAEEAGELATHEQLTDAPGRHNEQRVPEPRSGEVVLVGDVFEPGRGRGRVVGVVQHREVFHEGVRRGAVPMLFARWAVEGLAGVHSTFCPPRDCTQAIPWVMCRVWPRAWECHAVRAPGAKRTFATTVR